MEIQYFRSHSFQFQRVGTLSFKFSFILSRALPLANKREAKRPGFQRFARQLYLACLARIFAPLREGMTVPDVVRCPDGHFRRAIYSLRPYIADYPEQAWLAGVVQGWCPKQVSLSSLH